MGCARICRPRGRDVTLSIADVDLVQISIRTADLRDPRLVDLDGRRFTSEQEPPSLPQRIVSDPESVERGLVALVLTLVELLRQPMERQALRRVEPARTE